MIKVLLFAGLQEAAGMQQLELVANQMKEMTVDELKVMVAEAVPALQSLRHDRVMIAINEEIVPASSLIRDGDTVAFLPPVSGG